MKQDAYTKLTQRIIESLETVSDDFELPWRRVKLSPAFNANTHNTYQGINAFWLDACSVGQHDVNGWITYKQAQSLGGNIRKGEHGEPVIFFKILERPDRSNPDKTAKIPMARYSTVFNVSQCDGLPAFPVPEQDQTDILQWASSKADITHGGNKAYYRPSTDGIQLPNQDRFTSSDAYHSTLLHELIHWTGKRCERDLKGRFGDDAYAMEELVAEIGSTFLCAHFGIAYELEGHTSYLKHWLKVLQADKRAVFTAAKEAQKAVNYLINEEE